MSTLYTPLSRLPFDCWLMILDRLSTQDLAVVSRVSHETRASAEPFLYREIIWDWHVVPFRRLLKLLRTIFQRPELAAHVVRVSFVCDKTYDGRPYREQGDLNKTLRSPEYLPVLAFCISIVEQAEFPNIAVWKKALRTASGYALAAILISQLTNLRDLALDCFFILEGGFPGLMMKHALFSAPPGVLSDFTKLRAVDYGNNAGRVKAQSYFVALDSFPNSPFDPAQYIGWFFLPSLQVACLWLRSRQFARSLVEEAATRPWNLPRIRALQLSHSVMEIAELNALLPYMRSLRQLHLGLDYVSPRLVCRSSRDLQPGLRSVSATLEKLSLTPHFIFVPGMTQIDELQWENVSQECVRIDTGFFACFPRLRYVRVPYADLLGWGSHFTNFASTLPRTIQELHIRDCAIGLCLPDRRGVEVFDALNLFLAFHAKYFRFLRRIAIYAMGPFYCSEQFRCVYAHTIHLARQRGIRVQIVLFNGSPFI